MTDGLNCSSVVPLLLCFYCATLFLFRTIVARVRTVVAMHMHVDYMYGVCYRMVARDLWRRKTLVTLGLGSVHCHKSLAPCYNYNYIQSIEIG